MAYGGNLNDNICEKDCDYENIEEGEPRQDSFQLIKEPAFSVLGYPEAIQMGMITEYSDTSDNTSTSSSEGSKQSLRRKPTRSLERKNWSAETRRVLSSMPSRKSGMHSSAGLALQGRQTHAIQQHQTSSCDSILTARLTHDCIIQPELEEISTGERAENVAGSSLCGVGDHMEQLLSHLRGLTVSEGMRKLRTTPLSLADKREIRKHYFSHLAEKSLIRKKLPCYNLQCVYISRMWHHCTFNGLPFLSYLKLWNSSMKKLSGRYGTGVLSYFLFLRTLLSINLLLFIITCLFLVIPQAIHSPPNDSLQHSFAALNLLTGTGYLSESLMFYGYYSNITIETNHPAGNAVTQLVPYSIPTAYFFTITVSFFIICILLVYSMSKSFGRSFRVFKPHGNLSEKVFCFWDFKVSKKSSIRLQSEKISTQLKEQLSELTSGEDERSPMQRFCNLIVHFIAWLICLASIFLSACGVYFLSKNTISSEYVTLKLLLTSAVVSGINLLLPGIFNLCCWFEKHNSPITRVYVSIFRNLLLKISIIGVLCYQWFGKIAVKQDHQALECWENFVGQELYRLLLMDFLFTVLYTFLGEFLWRLYSKKMLKKNRKPVFDIARNVLELIYGQTLTWLGVLFAPLLPAVQIAKLFLLFYMKKSSLMHNCQASKKPWRATQMTTLFITLLCFPSFVGAAVSVGYTIWMIKPSPGCGPFRNLTSMFESGRLWAKKMKDSHQILAWLIRAYNTFLDNPIFLFLPTGIFLLVIYFHAQVVDGQRKIIRRLEKQIENEGKDKKFLISQLQYLREKNNQDSCQT
ncbi:PREDICTED: transmembrane channel-like protein 6 [Cyprinodon variegatus]|uniref:transmembrane channel-like protein 6 n=1 Tax=Cyprinodon variegatus TaxID=28743 RepID=UPI000742CB74|nr:PREDICTED: transmembrane channel-like protein 6 [Cyprinodon variegatus]